MLSADIDRTRRESGERIAEIRGLQLRTRRDAKTQNHLHRVRWRPSPPPRVDTTEAVVKEWLIVGDAPQTAGRLVEALRARGVGALIAPAGPLTEALPGIVHLAGVDSDRKPDAAAIGDGSATGCGVLLDILQSIVRRPAAETRLVVVTRGAVPALDSDRCDGIAHAPEWGLARVLAIEHPEIDCTCVDLDSGPPDVETLADSILRPDGESELAFRGGERYIARVEPSPACKAGPRRMEIQTRGSIDNIAVVPLPAGPGPGAGEIEVEVETSALNFRDVLNVLGMYPGDPGPLGLEFCGRVTRAGEGVHDPREGDLVAGIAWGSFADSVTTPAAFVMKVPVGMDAESAVTLPNAFLTAYHCLIHLARIAPGDRVLIHAASGGVGLACRPGGAAVLEPKFFATAGTE